MKHRLPLRLALALLVTAVSSFAQSDESRERAAAAQLLAFGRPAATVETGDAKAHVNDLLNAHRTRLSNDANARHEVITVAFRDAFGRIPTEAERAHLSASQATTYTDLMRQMTDWLASHPDEHRQVIDRAYRLVINRGAYEEEYAYWKPFGALPYTLLVGAIENWAVRNQPGLMVTTGVPSIAVNSRFLQTQRLSLPVANEVRTIIGLPVWTDVARLSNPGNNVVALRAGDIASVGGVHFMLTGGGPLAANVAN